MPTADPPKHPPRPRDEPIDITVLHERTMRRYPITMARLAEAERQEVEEERARSNAQEKS